MAKIANGSIIPEEVPLNVSQIYIKKMIGNIQNSKKYGNIYENIKINNDSTNTKNNSENYLKGRRKAITLNKPPNIINTEEYNRIMEEKNNSIMERMTYSKKILTYTPKKSIKLDNIGSISYSSYFESDILKLLSYLNQFEINDIKIVSHSALMKTFLNQKIIGDKKNIDDKLKIVEKKENMWSIILKHIISIEKEEIKSNTIRNGYTIGNEMESTFVNKKILREICITRHAFTIANLYKEEGQKMNQFFDKDTTLSLYGILGALNFNNPQHINLKNCNNTVFVSVLVRTWITALCLYLPQIDRTVGNNKFTLVVSPFIKESTKYIGIIRNTDDNLPIPINKQIIIIKNFLKFLREKISSNLEPVLEEYIKSSNNIRDFFDTNGVLEIYGVKEMKDKKFKYVKYNISYDSGKECYISTNKKENYFSLIPRKKPLEESPTRRCGLFGCKKNSEELKIEQLQILPGVRKPTTDLIISEEPLSKNEVKKFKNCTSDIKIGIIDIDERGKEFDKRQIEDYYNKNKYVFENSNILVVCSQRSSSQGSTKHFQHLLKEVLEEQTNTNFNFKNRNKENTTQVFSPKFLSPISGSKTGLRTRVYTQGLDNDKLDVKFDTIDFSATSSNEGAILCTIKYDGKDVINIMNSYAVNKHNVKTSSRIQFSNIYKLKKEILSKTFFCGYLNNIDWGVPIYTENMLNIIRKNPNTFQYQKPKVDFYIK
jgi:hypothetical protein